MTINFATINDLSWISKLELSNYGEDAWNYSQEDWLKQIAVRDPRIWMMNNGQLERNREGGNVMWVCKESYLQYTLQPSRPNLKLSSGGYYLTSFGGNAQGLEILFNHFFNLEKASRYYTHAKADWFRGNAFSILKEQGFKDIGPGDNSREAGKWKMDLSLLNEFEFFKKT